MLAIELAWEPSGSLKWNGLYGKMTACTSLTHSISVVIFHPTGSLQTFLTVERRVKRLTDLQLEAEKGTKWPPRAAPLSFSTVPSPTPRYTLADGRQHTVLQLASRQPATLAL